MSALPTRSLGRNGPQVTAEGYGAMGLSAFYGPPKPDPERFAVLDKVHSLGVRFWDSADIYMDNEDLIGQWFERTGKRSDIFLATKFAMFVNEDGTRSLSNEPEYIHKACAKSLRRLKTDVIDLYYCHRLTGKVPVETVVGAMAELVKEGKVKHIGLSECSAATLRRAHAVHPITAVQIEYSPWTMDIEDPKVGLLNACRELGVAVVAYSPLGRGMLTGTIRKPEDFDDADFRKNNPRFQGEAFTNNLKIVDTLQALASKKGITAGQLTLAWLMKQDPLVIPIPGTTREKNLIENVGALKVVLSDAEDKEIRGVIENAQIHGDRYPGWMMGLTLADTPPL